MIEAASTDDLDRLVELWLELIEHGRQQGLTMRSDANETVARQVLAAAIAEERTYVARSDERVVGFCSLSLSSGGFERDARRGVVENLYVEPGSRGDGIGSDLLEVGEERLVDLGAEELAVESAVADERVQAFYRERGYAPRRVQLAKRVETNR